MGNHTIDCSYCGKDKRLTGDGCCSDNLAYEKGREEAFQKKVKDAKDLLKKYEMNLWFSLDSQYIRVAEELRRLMKSGLLKEL